MSNFSPRLDVLPEAQRRLWGELSAVPNEFTLYGGTGLALHLGHRKSVDFDFFGSRAIDVSSLESEVPFLAGATVIQREKNTLSAIVDRGGPVKVSFFGVPKLLRLAPPLTAKDNGLQVASLLDLAGTKASVLQVRAEAKDYIDMDAPEITLKALSYFDDGNLRELPADMKLRLADAVNKVDLAHLPSVEDFRPDRRRDRELGL